MRPGRRVLSFRAATMIEMEGQVPGRKRPCRAPAKAGEERYQQRVAYVDIPDDTRRNPEQALHRVITSLVSRWSLVASR